MFSLIHLMMKSIQGFFKIIYDYRSNLNCQWHCNVGLNAPKLQQANILVEMKISYWLTTHRKLKEISTSNLRISKMPSHLTRLLKNIVMTVRDTGRKSSATDSSLTFTACKIIIPRR